MGKGKKMIQCGPGVESLKMAGVIIEIHNYLLYHLNNFSGASWRQNFAESRSWMLSDQHWAMDRIGQVAFINPVMSIRSDLHSYGSVDPIPEV